MWAVATLSVLVLALDVVVYGAACFGFNPQDWIRPGWVAAVVFWGLLALMIIVANAVVARRQANQQGAALPAHDNPLWFRRVMRVVILYSFFNLIVFGFPGLRRGEPTQQGVGVYVLDSGHGRPVQPISKEQYDAFRRNSLRATSGFLLMFYLQIAFDMVDIASGKALSTTSDAPRPRPYPRVYIIWRRS